MPEQMASQSNAPAAAPTGQPNQASERAPQSTQAARPQQEQTTSGGGSTPAPSQDGKPTGDTGQHAQGNSQYTEENFKGLQAQMSKTVTQLQRQMAEERRRAAVLQQQLEQVATRDMSDLELARFHAQKAQQDAAMMRAQMAELQHANARHLAQMRIADLTEIDPSELDDPNIKPDEAWEKGVTKLRSKYLELKKKVEGYEREESAPQTDLGGGTPQGAPDLQEQIAKAQSPFEVARIVYRNRMAGG